MIVNPKEFETAIGALASGYRVPELEQETRLACVMYGISEMDCNRPSKSKMIIGNIT